MVSSKPFDPFDSFDELRAGRLRARRQESGSRRKRLKINFSDLPATGYWLLTT